MTTKQKRIIFWIIGGLMIVLVSVSAWLYTGPLTKAKISVFATTGAPLAIIDFRPVSATHLKEKMTLVNSLNGQVKLSSNEALKAVMRDARVAAVARKYDAEQPGEIIDLAYDQVIANAGGDEAAFERNLKTQYNLTPAEFKRAVLKPIYTEIWLRSWYANNQNLQSGNTKLLESLQTRIQNGENFAQLAQTFSKDDATKTLGGDLGFISERKLVPELTYALSNTTKSNVVIAGSRAGLHLLQINDIMTAGGVKTYEARQIFLPSAGFDDWLKTEQDKISEQLFIR